MIWSVIKKAAADFWDEMLYLIIFNLTWFIGTLLIIPWPLVTFGLVFTAYDIGEGKGIKLSTFFSHARQMWKQAYIWGGLNLGIFIVLGVNLSFYANLQAEWAAIVPVIITALIIFWLVLQLITLAFYPRLEAPTFKLALRNAAVIIGRQPLAIFVLVILIGLIMAVAFFFQVAIFLGAFSLIAVLTNRLVEAVIKKELAQKQRADELNG